MNSVGSAINRRSHERGQALVVVVLAMVAMLAMAGLIVDGGNAWAQHRHTQNGADAASEAGATQLGVLGPSNVTACILGTTDPTCSATWDAKVAAAVAQSATDNQIDVPAAYYTDVCGALLRPDGTAASGLGDAALVGGGFLPTGTGPSPTDCSGSAPVGPVAGVHALGQHIFNTFLARVVGINSYQANTDATAVSGYLQQVCTGNSTGNCILLPVSFYYNIVACNGSGNATDSGTYWESVKGQRMVLPICKNASGNVGWLDWTGGGGGTAEIIDCLERAAGTNPCIPEVLPPKWFPISQSGGTSSGPLEDALNVYDGQVVQLAIWNVMCATQPDESLASDPGGTTHVYGCPIGDVCALSDTGCHPNWYHLQPFAPFELEHAYTSGHPEAECNPSWSNPNPDTNDTTNCLIGTFVDYSLPGTVGGSPNGSGAVGVQLIK